MHLQIRASPALITGHLSDREDYVRQAIRRSPDFVWTFGAGTVGLAKNVHAEAKAHGWAFADHLS